MTPEPQINPKYEILQSPSFPGFALQLPSSEPVWKAHAFLQAMDDVFKIKEPESLKGSWLKMISQFLNKLFWKV